MYINKTDLLPHIQSFFTVFTLNSRNSGGKWNNEKVTFLSGIPKCQDQVSSIRLVLINQ